MEKYYLNFHTVPKELVEVEGLDEAKQIAEEKMAYTQQPVTIEDLDGNIVAISRWWGYAPGEDEEDLVLTQFGDYGFYSNWEYPDQ